jgi:hypothetical protein
MVKRTASAPIVSISVAASVRRLGDAAPEMTVKAARSLARSQVYQSVADASSTLRAYKADLANFKAWCVERNLEPMPSTPEIVGAYLADAGRGYALSTLRRRVAAIARAHRMTKQPLDRPVRLSGTENRHRAIQKSHAEVGFLSGLRPPFITVSGSEKSYRPRKLRWRQISGERWAMSSLLTSMPSALTRRMASCM